MSEMPSSLRRFVRRSAVVLMVGVVLIGIALEWVLDTLNDVTKALIRVLGLKRVEDWMRKQALWFPLTLIALMCVGFVFFKIYELHLLMDKQIGLMLTLGLIFKVVYGTMINYLLHLYREQLLSISWIAKWYGRYARLRALITAYIKRQIWYERAVLVRARIIALFKKFKALFKGRSVYRVAQRILRRWTFACK